MSTAAVPARPQAQNPGEGRSPATSAPPMAVSSGSTAKTTAPWLAGACCIAIAIRSGKPMMAKSEKAASRGQSRRAGGGGRAHSSVRAASTAANSERPRVTNKGSKSATANRVAGRVSPKISTPSTPSRKAWRSRLRWRVACIDLSARACRSAAVASQQLARDHHAHDLVGALQNLVHPEVAHEFLEPVVLEIAVAPVNLQGLITDLEAMVRGKALGHGRVHGGLRIGTIERIGGAVGHQPRGFELRCHVRYFELQRLKVRERPTESGALEQVSSRLVQSHPSRTQGAGSDVDPPAIEPAHRKAEAAPGRTDQVGEGYFAVVEDHLPGGLRIPAHLFLVGPEGEARGVLHHGKGGDAVGTLLAGAREHEIKVACTRPGYELLAAIEKVVIA